MRPHSEIRIDLAAALVEGGGTTRQLAQRTGWSIGLTREALNNMARAGDCAKRFIRVAGVKRPVPFYERACRRADAARCNTAPLVSLIAAWAGQPAQAVRGVAMR